MQSNYNGSSPTSTGEKKKSNFNVGKLWCPDGNLMVSIWNSDKGGCYTIISAKAFVGKDPSTGANVPEQKMSGELPSIFMNSEILRGLLDAIEDCRDDFGKLNITIDTNRGSKMTMTGLGSSIKVVIESQKNGSRTVTLESIPVGNKNYHANFENLIKYLNICYDKAIRNKLDPDEFPVTESDELPI